MEKNGKLQTKEYLYIGHYTDENGNFLLKVGTTNDLKRRVKEHTRNYRKGKKYTLPSESEFKVDWYVKLSKYNTIRFEDRIRKKWQEMEIGEFIRNDRFLCENIPKILYVKIRKIYEVNIQTI